MCSRIFDISLANESKDFNHFSDSAFHFYFDLLHGFHIAKSRQPLRYRQQTYALDDNYYILLKDF